MKFLIWLFSLPPGDANHCLLSPPAVALATRAPITNDPNGPFTFSIFLPSFNPGIFKFLIFLLHQSLLFLVPICMDPEPSVYAWHQCWYPGQMNLIFYVSNLQLLGLSGVFALLLTLLPAVPTGLFLEGLYFCSGPRADTWGPVLLLLHVLMLVCLWDLCSCPWHLLHPVEQFELLSCDRFVSVDRLTSLPVTMLEILAMTSSQSVPLDTPKWCHLCSGSSGYAAIREFWQDEDARHDRRFIQD